MRFLSSRAAFLLSGLGLGLACGGAEQPLFSDRPGPLGDVLQGHDPGPTTLGGGEEATREPEKEPGDETTIAAPVGALSTPAAGGASPPPSGDGKPPRGPGPRASGDAGPPPADAPLPADAGIAVRLRASAPP